jgi:signal transduction histidine kinase/DNA-binding response OmpR family regulator
MFSKHASITRFLGRQFVVTAFTFLALGLTLYWSWNQVTVNREALSRTEVIERNLQLLGEDVLDAETGQRGYLLTLDASYLEPYLAATVNVPKRLDILARLMIDPTARSDLDGIRPLVSAKMAELAMTVALGTSHQQTQALKIVTAGSGKRLMDQIRAAREVAISREQNLFDQRDVHIDESMSRLARALLTGAVAIIVVLFFYTRRAVAEQQRYEESLHRGTQNAERANSAKSLFLANMSHEIRTPMNAVIGLTYLLEQTSLNSEQTGFISQIKAASNALLSVITDVLDISKIEAGELMISRVVFSPRELLAGLHAIMRPQAEFKGITLELDVPEDLPAALEGDAGRLNQILTNLLSNAIKFTERGGVTLSLGLLKGSPTVRRLSFTVRDTGIGIKPAAQRQLFTPFIQADESITRRYGGTGLGLSIIKSLATLMGGTVDFTSMVGVGSEFRVVLDFAFATEEALEATQSAQTSRGARPLAGVRVLVVDDYNLNLMVTQRILEGAGALVWVANNGHDAYEKLRIQPDHFDVVLMDVQMPIMDGYEAARRIRADLGLRNLPIIAVTAGALLSERQRATAVGMVDFIIKPFDASTLISSVMRHSCAADSSERVPPEAQSAADEAAWPEISGIDMEDARKRVGDDPALFRSWLQRFLVDFSDIAGWSSRTDIPELADQASRLHKLKGGAGILGAKAIQQLAGEAEEACLAGKAVEAGERTILLVVSLDALRLSATRAFKGGPNNDRTSAALTSATLEAAGGEEPEPIDALSKSECNADLGRRCSVLVVDDDEIVREYIVNLLERTGYQVAEAASGAEALQVLRDGDYQILITDWKMPGMSGLELCRELRAGVGNRDLYVMMLTMCDGQQDADLCRGAGADAYVLKNATAEKIVARMAVARKTARRRSSDRENARA